MSELQKHIDAWLEGRAEIERSLDEARVVLSELRTAIADQRHVERLAARLYSTYFQSNPSNDQDYAELTARRALSAARAIIAQNREGNDG